MELAIPVWYGIAARRFTAIGAPGLDGKAASAVQPLDSGQAIPSFQQQFPPLVETASKRASKMTREKVLSDLKSALSRPEYSEKMPRPWLPLEAEFSNLQAATDTVLRRN
jgi:hypothetical protein